MTCATGIVERLFLVRWDEPVPSDVHRVVTEVGTASERLGQKLYFIAVTPANSKPPDEPTRRVFAANLPRLLERCESLHLIIEGTGFSSTVRRAVAAGLFLVSGKRKSMFVHDDIHAALEMTPYASRKLEIVTLARSQGILQAA